MTDIDGLKIVAMCCAGAAINQRIARAHEAGDALCSALDELASRRASDATKDARIAALEAEVAKWKAESEKWQRSNTIATDAVARVLGLMALSPYDKDRHIHALESALKVAEEALVMVRGMSGLTWTARHYELVNTALFAIKEAKS